MKRGILLLTIALLAGLLAFFGIRSYRSAVHKSALLDSMPELSWMRSELSLDENQFAEISRLHMAYRPKCEAMCQRISDASHSMESLIQKNPEVTPELEQAIRHHALVRAECQQAMLVHLFETAKLMGPEQSAHYLHEMLPFALASAHSEPR